MVAAMGFSGGGRAGSIGNKEMRRGTVSGRGSYTVVVEGEAWNIAERIEGFQTVMHRISRRCRWPIEG